MHSANYNALCEQLYSSKTPTRARPARAGQRSARQPRRRQTNSRSRVLGDTHSEYVYVPTKSVSPALHLTRARTMAMKWQLPLKRGATCRMHADIMMPHLQCHRVPPA